MSNNVVNNPVVNNQEPTANDIQQFLKLKKVANYLNDNTIGTIEKLKNKEIKLADNELEDVSLAVRKHVNKAINGLRDEMEDNFRDQLKRSQNRILERVQELLDYQKTVNNVTKIKEDEEAEKEAEKPPTSNNIINAMANIPNGITAIGSVIKNVSEKAYDIANNALGNNAPKEDKQEEDKLGKNKQEPEGNNQGFVEGNNSVSNNQVKKELPQDAVDEIANQIVDQINNEKEEKENLEKNALENQGIEDNIENVPVNQKQVGGKKKRRKTHRSKSKRKRTKRKEKSS